MAYLRGWLATRGDLPPFHGASSGRQSVSGETETSRTYIVIWKDSVANPLPWVTSFLLPLTNASSPPGKMSALVTEEQNQELSKSSKSLYLILQDTMPEVFFPPLYIQTWVLAEAAAPVTGGILPASVPATPPMGPSLRFQPWSSYQHQLPCFHPR